MNIYSGVSQLFCYISCFFRTFLFSVLSVGPIPNHIALIMDGNRRFAKKRNMLEGDGHKAGSNSLLSILDNCYQLGVKYITVYAFSIENFKRKPDEVDFLMKLIVDRIQDLLKEGSIVDKFGMRFYFIGNLKLLSDDVRIVAENAMKATAHNTGTVLLVCMAYTSSDEIVHAVEESCMEKIEENGFSVVKLGDLERNMYMSVAPDPDMVIRSSGETRLSNFLLWQSAYSVLYSPSALWPEIGVWHLVWLVLDYQRNYSYLQKQRKQQ